jgi:hypothetical protein
MAPAPLRTTVCIVGGGPASIVLALLRAGVDVTVLEKRKDFNQRRRDFPTRVTQSFQVMAHGFLERYLGNSAPAHAPWQVRVLSSSRLFRRFSARFIGLGVRLERLGS